MLVACLLKRCRRQPSPPTITAGGSGFVVFVVASPRLPLSQRVAQALWSLWLPALASRYHSGWLRLCGLCGCQPSPPTITAGGSGFVVFVVASPRLPLSQRVAQALWSLWLPALASHYHSGWLRLCGLCGCQPSPPTITAGGSGFVVFVVASPRLPLSQRVAQALWSLWLPALASRYHSGWLRLCGLCGCQPSPPTITAGGSGFVVFVVASPRLPLSQRVAQALWSLWLPALASHYHSGWLRLCGLCGCQPSPASHYHSGWLRLCGLCGCQPSPPTITAGGSGFVVFVVASPRLSLSQRAAQAVSPLSLKMPPKSKWEAAEA